MPAQRRKVLGHVVTDLCTRMNRTKKLPGVEVMETPLNRCLNTFDITLLGVGHMVGAGIYVLTGTVARDVAGPGIVVSFILAGLTSLLAALCYAEFGTRVPRAGSAYVYTYCSIGEFWAFVIGWNIILEHMIGAASVARAWSGYVDALFDGAISNSTTTIFGEMNVNLLGKYPDVLAFLVCLSYAGLLGIGVKTSAMINSVFTLVNLAVMAVVVCIGFYFADIGNWTSDKGFLPYGFSGVIAGAATCFYAFVGFDSIATSGEEAKNPEFSIPVATIVSMSIVTIGYVLVGSALTLMVKYTNIDPKAALPQAFSSPNMPWVKYLVSVGALCGMTTTLFGSLFSLPRCMYAMSSDGLLFKFLGNVNEKTQVPLANLAVSGIFSAIIALLFDLEKLIEFMSIGTLLAYTIVSASVIILRYKPDSAINESKPLKDGDDVSILTTSTQSDNLDLSRAGKLKPEFWWLSNMVGGCGRGGAPSACVFMFTCCSAALFVQIRFSGGNIVNKEWWSITVLIFLILCLLGCILIISAHHQNVSTGTFRVPWVPIVPGLSILCNVGLMVYLNVKTWERFMVWMALGLLVYFLYGIRHSKESENTSTYSMLMSSSEANKGPWGTMSPREDPTATVSQTEQVGSETIVEVRKIRKNRQKSEEDNEALIDDDDD